MPYVREAMGAIVGAAVAFLALIVFYEGLPVPAFLRWVPGISDLTDGRVDRAERAAREGYVREAELAAERAKNAELVRQLEAGRKAAEGFALLLAEAQRANTVQEEIFERERAEYEQRLQENGRDLRLNDDDIRFIVRGESAP